MNNKHNHKTAHQHSINHRQEIMESETCACFHCLKTFTPSKITEWVDENEKEIGQTAMCPYCAIDSVIGDKSGIPLTKEFLSGMKQTWFSVE